MTGKEALLFFFGWMFGAFMIGWLAYEANYRPHGNVEELAAKRLGGITLTIGYCPNLTVLGDPVDNNMRGHWASDVEEAIENGIWDDKIVKIYNDPKDAIEMREKLFRLLD